MSDLLERINRLLVNEAVKKLSKKDKEYIKKYGKKQWDYLQKSRAKVNKAAKMNKPGPAKYTYIKQKIHESTISSMAKRTLIGLIKKPNKGTVNIDGMKITSTPTKDGVKFTLPADDFEISMALTDISDQLGYIFDTKISKQHMTFEVKPK